MDARRWRLLRAEKLAEKRSWVEKRAKERSWARAELLVCVCWCVYVYASYAACEEKKQVVRRF
jgi:hypothetical protein